MSNPTTEFLVRIKGAYAGFARCRQIKSGDDWILKDETWMSINMQGSVKPLRIFNEAEVDHEFRLMRFKMRVATGIISFDLSGKMEGNTLGIGPPQVSGRRNEAGKVFRKTTYIQVVRFAGAA